MKTLTFTLLLSICFLQSANAATYYLSAKSGDDSRSVKEAQDPSTPWKTLSKLNSFFKNLRPGDAVLLKRGETFYGNINVASSGSTGSPIVIGAYGSGDKPVITSLVTFSKWVSKGNGIWESYNSSFNSEVRTVLLDGEQQELGRYPNSNAGNKGYLTFESHQGTSSITDADFSLNKNWKGAEVVIRTRRWILDRNKITSNNGKKIFYISSSNYAPYDKQGYFIQKDIKTLDKFGEWYYNTSTNKLSVFFGSHNPSSYTVQAPSYDNLIYSVKFSNIRFENLNFKGANGTNVFIKYGSNIKIQNCNIQFSGHDGVEAKYTDNFNLENCTVANSNNTAIDLGYGGRNAVIRNNKIINTSMFPGMGGSGDGQSLGIQSNGDGNILERNEIRNTGYIGINFSGNNVTIKNNLIDNFCTIKDDGAAIYSHTGSNTVYKGRQVIGNIILNGLGAPDGTSNPSYSPAEGIYMDNDASNVAITDNTIANCKNNGVYVHNAYGMVIKNNTIFNNSRQLNVIEDPDHSRIRNCEFSNNIFFSKLSAQYISYITASGNDLNLFGNFNNNYYARPIKDELGIFSSYVKNGKIVSQKLDLEDWKKMSGQDKASKKAPKEIAAYKIGKLTGSNKVGNGIFSNNLNGIHQNSCKTSWSKMGILDGGYLKVDPQRKKSSVFINIGEIKAGKTYVLRYSSKSSTNNPMSIGTFLQENGHTYASVAHTQLSKATTERSENEIIFSPLISKPSVYLVFEADQKFTYYLDNIELYEASVSVTNPDEAIKFVYNASTGDKSIALSGNYIDVKGKKFSKSITLKPFTSAVLIEDGSKPSKNNPPSVNITSPGNGANLHASAINIAANASDEDGTISKVEFYNGKTLLATEYSKPYSFTWKNVASGTYHITAVATDNDGDTKSDDVKVTVAVNKPPTITIVKPVDKQKFTGPATIRLIADAKDSDGKISRVEFYNGSELLRIEYKYPYTYWWRNVAPGTYKITAIATDDDGRQTKSESVEVSVVKAQHRETSNSGDTAALDANSADSIENARASRSIVNNSSLSLKLSPNPVNNVLNIVTKGLQQNQNMQISVLSSSGMIMKTVQSNTSDQNVQLDVSSLQSGIYIIRIVSGDKILSKQFVKL